jgi:hypothetical protein
MSCVGCRACKQCFFASPSATFHRGIAPRAPLARARGPRPRACRVERAAPSRNKRRINTVDHALFVADHTRKSLPTVSAELAKAVEFHLPKTDVFLHANMSLVTCHRSVYRLSVSRGRTHGCDACVSARERRGGARAGQSLVSLRRMAGSRGLLRRRAS